MKKVICVFLVVTNMAMAKIASYYAEPFHGRITASGYKYNMNDMTCASMDYPFGTVLKVTNKDNGKSVKVVVTDTGSFKDKYKRDIDLSKEAFRRLDKLGKGLLNVDIEVINSDKIFRYKHGGKNINVKDYII